MAVVAVSFLLQASLVVKALHWGVARRHHLTESFCSFLKKRGGKLWVSPERVAEEKMMNKKVLDIRLWTWSCYLTVLAFTLSVLGVSAQLNVITGKQRWMSPALDWVGLGLLALAAAPVLHPGILWRRHALDLYCAVIFVCVSLAMSPAGSSPDELFVLMMLSYVLFEIPASCMTSRTWLVILCNLAPILVLMVRSAFDSFDTDCIQASSYMLFWIQARQIAATSPNLILNRDV